MRRRARLLASVLALALAGAGCLRAPEKSTASLGPPAASPRWERVTIGIERMRIGTKDASPPLTLYRFETERFDWRFASASIARTIAEWGREFPEAAFISNGTYFHEDQRPSGLLITDGKRVGDRQFDWDRSGVLAFTPEPRIVDTKIKRFDMEDAREAAQSYPFLLHGGQMALSADSGREARRTFVGLDQAGTFYVGFVTDGEISLRKLAERLLTVGIAWTDVLNLDGGPSSGYLVAGKDGGREDGFTPIPIVIVATRRH